MLTKSPNIVHVAEVPVGSLFYYAELGDGILFIAAQYDGQQGPATIAVPLTKMGTMLEPLAMIEIEHLSGSAALVEGFRAEVDLTTSTNNMGATVSVAKDGTYISVRSDHPLRGRRLRLEDGKLVSSIPSRAVAFARWRIVCQEDDNIVLWTSDGVRQEENEETQSGRQA